jgi:hypothetical protein
MVSISNHLFQSIMFVVQVADVCFQIFNGGTAAAISGAMVQMLGMQKIERIDLFGEGGSCGVRVRSSVEGSTSPSCVANESSLDEEDELSDGERGGKGSWSQGRVADGSALRVGEGSSVHVEYACLPGMGDTLSVCVGDDTSVGVGDGLSLCMVDVLPIGDGLSVDVGDKAALRVFGGKLAYLGVASSSCVEHSESTRSCSPLTCSFRAWISARQLQLCEQSSEFESGVLTSFLESPAELSSLPLAGEVSCTSCSELWGC